MAPFAEEVSRLDTIPGVNRRTAEVLIAEIGVDMSAFPTAGHLASWAGLCPGTNESAGKHRSGRTRKGNRWLRSVLIQAALAGGTRSTKGALAARYRRVMRHRGHKKAVVAVAHAMLVAHGSRFSCCRVGPRRSPFWRRTDSMRSRIRLPCSGHVRRRRGLRPTPPDTTLARDNNRSGRSASPEYARTRFSRRRTSYPYPAVNG